ncbi:MAG: hypothetical protein WDN00_08550 [Limisphaerales bacterium]
MNGTPVNCVSAAHIGWVSAPSMTRPSATSRFRERIRRQKSFAVGAGSQAGVPSFASSMIGELGKNNSVRVGGSAQCFLYQPRPAQQVMHQHGGNKNDIEALVLF